MKSISLIRACMLAALFIARAGISQTPTFTAKDLLDVKEPALVDVSGDGKWIAIITSTPRRHLGPTMQKYWGDPSRSFYFIPDPGEITVVDARSGAVVRPLPADRDVFAATFSPDGSRLALVVKKGEDFQPVLWDRATGTTTEVALPAQNILPGGGSLMQLTWSPDGKELMFALRTRAWQKEVRDRFNHLVSGDIVVMSGSDPFLPFEALDREGGRYTIVAYDLQTKKLREILPMGFYSGWYAPSLSSDGLRVSYERDTVTKTPYGPEWKSGKRSVAPFPAGGEARALAERQVALEVARDAKLEWAADGKRYAYSKKGGVFVGDLDGSERQIVGAPVDTSSKPASKPDSTKRAPKPEEMFNLVRLAKTGDWLLASNSQGMWEVDARSGSRVPVSAADTTATGRQFAFEAEVDGGMILTASARSEWKTGIFRYERGGKLVKLLEDSRRYGSYRPEVKVAKGGSTIALSAAEGSIPGDIYAMDGSGQNLRRLTHANPKFDDERTRRSELFSYLDADGRRSYGVIYYPFNYEKGKAYPTIVHPYEGFFNDEYEATDKTLNSAGYVVVRPSVPSKQHPGYPSEAWMKGVSVALNQLIDRGLTDSSKVGVYGCSYGGYATNLLITQTPRFKAAVNIAGLTNLVSMYTDSPRLGLRNMFFSESTTGQFPMTGTLWQEPQKYVQNSPLFYFDRVTTPVLIISGSEDHNVIVGQQQEAFYALRRLGKTVDWVMYRDMGHCLPNVSEKVVEDFHSRIIGWFDKYVKNAKKP
jgi:dipeptidyl aminopeptidase/acylaminoacyl peptidase